MKKGIDEKIKMGENGMYTKHKTHFVRPVQTVVQKKTENGKYTNLYKYIVLK